MKLKHARELDGSRWDGTTVDCVVDNRVFLLGLDNLYREAMKEHERGELLSCARRVAGALQTIPAQVPVEGYYTEDAQLTEYFQLMRALQALKKEAAATVSSLPEFQRLKEITSSRLYGLPNDNGRLFPPPRDALSLALLNTYPQWTVPVLTAAAYDAAVETDDYSLVGLAARAKDPVVLTALRESVVLYLEAMAGAALLQPRYVYTWKVDEDIERAARSFIDTFKTLFGDELPAPDPTNAKSYWHAASWNLIAGRCVNLGNDGGNPKSHYHWAISREFHFQGDHEKATVVDFWRPEIWTTERYRRSRGH